MHSSPFGRITSPLSMYEQSSGSRHGSHSNAPISSTSPAQKIPYRTSSRPIAGRDYDAPPPPLPPPRFLPGTIAQHHVPSIRENINTQGGAGSIGTGSVSPESSLARGNWDRPQHMERRMSQSIEGRRESFPAIWLGSENYDMRHGRRPELPYEFGFKDEGYSSLSGSSFIHRLVIHRWP